VNSKQISYLRGLAHNLNPVVMISNKGLSEAVLKEINLNLDAHEQTNAKAIHHIGKQLVVYRKSTTKPKIVVPIK
jgi:RNA-binding protein